MDNPHNDHINLWEQAGLRLSTVADSRLKRKQMVSIDSNTFHMFVHLFGIVDTWNMSSKIIDVDLRTPKCLLVDEQLTVCQPVWVTFMISFFMPSSKRNPFLHTISQVPKCHEQKSKTFIFLEVPSLKVTSKVLPDLKFHRVTWYTPRVSRWTWPGSYMPF